MIPGINVIESVSGPTSKLVSQALTGHNQSCPTRCIDPPTVPGVPLKQCQIVPCGFTVGKKVKQSSHT